LRQASQGIADIAIADYMFQSEGFESLADPDVPTAIVMHDLFHIREARSPDGRILDSAVLVDRDTECQLLARADAVIAIQAAEARFVAEHMPRSEVVLSPMAADPVDRPYPGDSASILFVGSNTAPNVVGLKWFFEEVWPAIHAASPQTRLSIAGTVAWAFPNGGPTGTRFLGLVDDLDALYKEAGLVISPLTFGSGLKIKLIEAMAYGKAIVATSVTLQGVEAICVDAVASADTSAEFGGHVLDLLGDDEARSALAASSLAAAREHFSRDACYGAFQAWLKNTSSRRMKPVNRVEISVQAS
jgi:succinoglycan biosynthesis protein ExoO